MKNAVFSMPLAEDPHEFTRKTIQDHPHFGAWYRSLGNNTRTAFDLLYLTDVTPELIQFAREIPEAEWWQSVFLRVIGGGNPDPFSRTLLTQHALLTVIADLERFAGRSQPRIS